MAIAFSPELLQTFFFSHFQNFPLLIRSNFLVFLGYLWACVVSLFHIIFIVKSKKYRSVYGDNPLQVALKPILNKSSRKAKVERVKFYPSPNFNKEADKLKSSPKLSQSAAGPYGMGQSRRIRNEYIEMRHNYLNKFNVGHGQNQYNDYVNR